MQPSSGGESITFFCTWQSPRSPIPGWGTPEHNRRSWHLSNNFIPYSCPIASQSHHTLQIISSSAAKTWAPNQIVSQEEVGSLAHANMGLPPPKPHPSPHECSYTVLGNSKLWGTKKPSKQRTRKTSLSLSLSRFDAKSWNKLPTIHHDKNPNNPKHFTKMNMFLLPNYPLSPLYLQNPQLETRGRTTKTTHVLRQQKTTKNKSKKLLQHNTTQHT